MQSRSFKFGLTTNPLTQSLYDGSTWEGGNPSPPQEYVRVTNAYEDRITNVTSDTRVTNVQP